jgi:hypothetical protein
VLSKISERNWIPLDTASLAADSCSKGACGTKMSAYETTPVLKILVDLSRDIEFRRHASNGAARKYHHSGDRTVGPIFSGRKQQARSRCLRTLRHFGGSPKSRRMCIELSVSSRMFSFFHSDDPSANFLQCTGIHALARFLLTCVHVKQNHSVIRSGELKC